MDNCRIARPNAAQAGNAASHIIKAPARRTMNASSVAFLTGTPAGVGLATGSYLVAGDVIEMSIDGIGVLRNTVVAAH